MMRDGKAVNVDEYVLTFPKENRSRMTALRKRIQQCVPSAVECISYSMPAYKYKGKPLVYFACYAHHIGLYATPVSHEAFQSKLKKYKQGKGSVQFPHDEELPLDLIIQMIEYRRKVIDEMGK